MRVRLLTITQIIREKIIPMMQRFFEHIYEPQHSFALK